MKALFPLPQFCVYPSASRTAFQMSNDDSVSIMSCYITALALRAPQHSSLSFHLWLTPYMDLTVALTAKPVSQSASLTATHSQQACVEKRQ